MYRLDYCNSLPFGITDDLKRLQDVQNAAARLGPYHTSPVSGLVLGQLLLGPVNWRLEYKLAVLTYNTVHGLLSGSRTWLGTVSWCQQRDVAN